MTGGAATAAQATFALSYLLVPESPERTRLLLKAVMQVNPLVAAGPSLGDLVMARRQLLDLKRLAEAPQ